MTGEFVVKGVGGHRRLIINCRGCNYGCDVAQFPKCMSDVVNALKTTDADEVVLSEYYERIYDKNQTKVLKEIANLASQFESDALWTPSHLGKKVSSSIISKRHNEIRSILDIIPSDPFNAYLTLLRIMRTYIEKAKTLSPEALEDLKIYLETLNYMKTEFEKTELIKKMRMYLAKMNMLPKDRTIYHSLFHVAIKPSFIGSRIFFESGENLELVDEYEVMGSKTYIYKHPEKIEYLYFINPPEYSLPPEKYFILEKTKEVVANYRPKTATFMSPSEARRYFHRVYMATISDIARHNNISLSVKDKEELARIVARYTIGYGIMEILLSDRKLTDIYIDSPVGIKPIYLVHSKYGQCQTNIIFSPEEVQSLVSRFRAFSGRPFDEAHPVLDFDLPDLQTRICVIGKPLASDGTAFTFRLHKVTPWTLSQFLDHKMFTPLAAGMFSFFVDAQASMLIVGSRGAGKTSFLQAMMLEIPQNLRIIVQEDTQELPVPAMKEIGFNIQRMKTRPPLGKQSESEVSAEDALRTALRLGDSVLIVGEVRSTEARALYEAMRVGAVGNVVMGTIHGESAYSIWDRVVNDLGVPTTSFKATDFAIVAAPIRFKGSLKRSRRVIEVTEVKKEWNEDPLREGGFNTWMTFDANKDNLELFEDALKESPWIKKIERIRALKFDDIWSEINTRGASKQYLVDLKNKYNIPEILEAVNSVRAQTQFMLLKEKYSSGKKIDFNGLLKEWKKWADEVLLKEILQKRKALASTKQV